MASRTVKLKVQTPPVSDAELRALTDYTDVSELENTERALRNANTLLQKTFDSLNEAVFIVQFGTRIIQDINITAENMFGYSRKELIGATTSFLHSSEEMFQRFSVEMLKSYEEKGLYETTFQMKRKDGTIFFSEHCVTPIRDELGQITSHVCVVRDISERITSERILKSTVLEQKAILENSCVGITLTKNRQFVWLNSRFEEMFGYATGELEGKSLRIVYPSEMTFESFGKTIYAVIAQGLVYETELKVMRKDSSQFWAKISGKAIDPADLSAGAIWIVEDISARKQAETELTEKTRLLEELNTHLEARVHQGIADVAGALETARATNEEQKQLIDLISHELRTPLSIIDGAAQLLLLTACPDSDCLLQADRIRSASKRLSSLVDTCLTDERISSRWAPDFRDEQIRDIIIDLIPLFQQTSDRHTITTDISSLPDIYLCDAGLLQIMLGNLIENALKYLPDGGDIVVRGVSAAYGEICIQVSDQGVGFAPEHQDKIFDRFYRTWQVPNVPGAGIGLHLVKKIAEIHCGGVACASIPGKGSTFTVWLRTAI